MQTDRSVGYTEKVTGIGHGVSRNKCGSAPATAHGGQPSGVRQPDLPQSFVSFAKPPGGIAEGLGVPFSTAHR